MSAETKQNTETDANRVIVFDTTLRDWRRRRVRACAG